MADDPDDRKTELQRRAYSEWLESGMSPKTDSVVFWLEAERRSSDPTSPRYDQDLRRKQLERLLTSASSAISRSRATWLLSVTATFILAVHLYNVELSQNFRQLDRKAETLSSLLRSLDEIDAELRDNPKGRLANQLLQWDANTGVPANPDTGYLGYLWRTLDGVAPSDRSTATTQPGTAREQLDTLRYFARRELELYVQRRVAFDTVAMPIVGVSISASDFGRIGGAALVILGFWLLANLRGELLAVSHFVSGGPRQPYTQAERAYAIEAIRRDMVFTATDGAWHRRLTSYATLASFFLPPGLLIINCLTTWWGLRNKALGDFLQWDVLTEFGIAGMTTFVWWRAYQIQKKSMQLLSTSRGSNPTESSFWRWNMNWLQRAGTYLFRPPGERQAGRPSTLGRTASLVRGSFIVGTPVAALVSTILMFKFRHGQIVPGAILLCWAIAPPTYFFFEYLILGARENTETDPDVKMRRDEMKMFYDLASKIWIAVFAVLLGIAKGFWFW